MIEPLKPCPCCNSTNIVIETYDVCEELNKQHSGVVCRGCGLNIVREARAEAVKAWNKRAEPKKSAKHVYYQPYQEGTIFID